jgi:hypothetical protein
MPVGFEGILNRLVNKDMILPYFEMSMLADRWPDSYDIKVDSSPYYGAGDGYFHPSTHPLMGERQLYLMFHPDTRDKMIGERKSLKGQMTLAMGSALHAVLQTQMTMAELIHKDDIEVEYINHDHHVRGRIDWIAHLPNGLIVPVEFKALDCATPILTTRGWSTMGELKDGDEVFAPDGHPTKVIQAHPIRFDRPCYEVSFRDGQSVVSDEDHLWQVYDRWRQRDRVLTTKEIAESPGWTKGKWYKNRFCVSCPEPLQAPDADLPVDPWLLGMWLGDGSTRDPEITCGESDLPYLCERLDNLDIEYEAFYYNEKAPKVALRGWWLLCAFRELGLMWLEGGKRKGRKFIPEQYMTASESQRRELLAGLLDSDGTVGDHQVAIGMKNHDLMRQVLQLVRSLGYRATFREHRARLNQKDAGPFYWVKFSTGWGDSPFDMPRKWEQFDSKPTSFQNNTNSITSITPVESRPTRCITVAHESALYLVGEGFVPTHNTRMSWAFKKQDQPELSWLAQLNLGMDATGYDFGILLMLESGFPYQMREFHVRRDQRLLDDIYGKFDRVREAIATNTKPRACCAYRSKEMAACPARFVCWESDDPKMRP